MTRRITILLVAISLVWVTPFARAGKYVQMYKDETYTTKVKRKKLDCNIHQEKKKGLSLGFKVNVAYLVTAGPEISFTEETKMHWNDSCQELIRRYEELCDEHNQGNLTLAEFERRRKELDNYYERMIKLKQ